MVVSLNRNQEVAGSIPVSGSFYLSSNSENKFSKQVNKLTPPTEYYR